MKFSTPATRDENPHCGMDFVPFIKRTTSFVVTVSLICVSAVIGMILSGAIFLLKMAALL
jgi:hypothetical protein